jgi:hypothetical protein
LQTKMNLNDTVRSAVQEGMRSRRTRFAREKFWRRFCRGSNLQSVESQTVQSRINHRSLYSENCWLLVR